MLIPGGLTTDAAWRPSLSITEKPPSGEPNSPHAADSAYERRLMKAFLLAGGRGERLRPLTLTIPKCLAPINGTPVLAVWLDLLEREGIDEVLLNVSHHVTQVQTFLRARTRGPRVHLSIENEPIGTAGSVRANRSLVDGDESFWILYADNLTDVRLQPIRDLHARHDGVLTIGLFHAPNPRAAGIVTLDETGRVVDFIEKLPDV